MPWKEYITTLRAGDVLDATQFGQRCERLSLLACEGVPVANGAALSAALVADIAKNGDQLTEIASYLVSGLGAPLVVRASPQDTAWGGPASVIGVADPQAPLETTREIAMAIGGLDQADFNGAGSTGAVHARFAELTDEAYPADPANELAAVLGGMAKAWARPSTRILRTAQGAPDDAGLALLVQRMIPPTAISGVAQLIDPETGRASFSGEIRGASSFTELSPAVREALDHAIRTGSRVLRDAARVDFVVMDGTITVIGLEPAHRSSRADLRVVTDLVEQGILGRDEALLRIEPYRLVEHLHPQVASEAVVDVFGTGIGASPGAARGILVFSANAAQAAAAQGEDVILVRAETSPEDIRGMSSAAGVLTLTGGTTSHAAVIAQGLGVPCVVGASALHIDPEAKTISAPDGRSFGEGAVMTLNGTDGAVLVGEVELTSAELSHSFRTLMTWADETRTLGVRANADTPQDARAAKEFGVDGLGLCRSEHMFYAADRLDVMREVILTKDAKRRRAALDRLLPMQRDDFREMFEIMSGRPVTIRLLDPPLHEFLPRGGEEVTALARSMGLDLAVVRRRIEEMEEYNPMLGMRGVRLAMVVPEIYDMQAEAIFEAAIAASKATGQPVQPEIMIPLVSAKREVEIVSENVARVAERLTRQSGVELDYKIGVMVETPRAALRAGDIAGSSAFLSFGTNDLTQMTYGMSRDDSGRFMREYVQGGVFQEDPFLTLDLEGVGELILIAARRAKAANDDLTLGLCGEHGGDPSSVRFCLVAGFDYVSCSPFRVPIARLAAAQASILSLDANRL